MAEPIARLSLFGGVDLVSADAAAAQRVLVQPKAVATLGFLAIEAAGARSRRFQRRDRLAGMLWPEIDQGRARAALRKTVFFLRGALGAEIIVSRGDEELALGDGMLWCDAAEFVEAIQQNRLARALELCGRNDLMPGFHLPECGEFGRWLEDRRSELRQEAAAAAWALARQFEESKHFTDAGVLAIRAARAAWDDERVLRRAMSMLDRLGNRAGALQLYDDFARRLDKELNATPSPETVALASTMRTR